MKYKDRVVSYPVAKLMSDKQINLLQREGFEDPDETLMYGLNSQTGQYELHRMDFMFDDKRFKNTDPWYYAPTQTMLARFLREEKNILIEILIDKTTEPAYVFSIWKYEDFGNWTEVEDPEGKWLLFRNYEEALNEALLIMLRVI